MNKTMSMLLGPELFLKPDAVVRNAGDYFEKKVSVAEVSAYGVLAQYARGLRGDNIEVVIPQVLGYDVNTGVAKLSNVGDFKNVSPSEYFGESEVYTSEYLTTVHGACQLLRQAIPPEAVPDQTDYEAMHNGRISSVEYLARGMPEKRPAMVGELFDLIHAIAVGTQSIVTGLPQYASHRDPNPNNYLVTRRGNGYRVALVDWETFGLSRVGYDEGRLMSYLAMDERKQAGYGALLPELLPDTPEQMYFWRVAALRSFKEITSFVTGHYDNRLCVGEPTDQKVDERRQAIIRGLSGVILRSAHMLESMGVAL